MVEPHARPGSSGSRQQHAYPAAGLLCIGGLFAPPVYVTDWRAGSDVETDAPSHADARAR